MRKLIRFSVAISFFSIVIGCNLVGFDQSSCLYVMKAVNTRDPVTQVSPVYLVSMLEYTMGTGYDWWDVIAAIKPGRFKQNIM